MIRSLWNVQLFSSLMQALSNKCETRHANWKIKFYHWFINQSSVLNWHDLAILILSNTCLTRLNSIQQDELNVIYQNLDKEWIRKMSKCLKELASLSEIKSILNKSNNNHIILNLSETQKLNQEWYHKFNYDECYKRIPSIKQHHEDLILAAISLYIANNKKSTKELDQYDTDVIITTDLIDKLVALTEKKYSPDLIKKFLNTIYNTVYEKEDDEADNDVKNNDNDDK